MQELKDFHLTGNIIHTAWFKTITKDNGKADLVAINILGEIVYWYKPTEIRAEITGEHLGWRNKYKGDLLQKSYSSLAEQFGLGERQVKDAIIRLEKLGVIKRVFRNIINNGMILNNVLYIELNFDGLKKISTPPSKDECNAEKGQDSHKKGTPPTPECHTPHAEKGQPPHEKGIVPTPECHTNTEITTETTEETTTEINIHIDALKENDDSPTKKDKEIIKQLFIDYVKGDDELLQALIDFLKMRKAIRSPLSTERAARMLLNNLDMLGTTAIQKIEILNQSILNNWKGVFELKNGSSNAVYKGNGYSVENNSKDGANAFDRLRSKYGGD